MIRPRLLLAMFLLPLLGRAQNTSCALSGSVQDPTGAAIPRVSVTLVDEANGFVRTTTTTLSFKSKNFGASLEQRTNSLKLISATEATT